MVMINKSMAEAFLYRWTEIATNKWYVGSRTAKGCHPDDGYICSSKYVKPMIEANPDEWVREVLVKADPIVIRKLECRYLTLMNAAKNDMSYNRSNADGFFYARPMTEAAKAHLSKINMGKKHTQASKDKMSATRLRLAQVPWNKGIPPTDEVRRKISVTLSGRKLSPEQVAKMRERVQTPESNAKRSAALKGKPVRKTTPAIIAKSLATKAKNRKLREAEQHKNNEQWYTL